MTGPSIPVFQVSNLQAASGLLLTCCLQELQSKAEGSMTCLPDEKDCASQEGACPFTFQSHLSCSSCCLRDNESIDPFFPLGSQVCKECTDLWQLLGKGSSISYLSQSQLHFGPYYISNPSTRLHVLNFTCGFTHSYPQIL